jgi:hypothetical protein
MADVKTILRELSVAIGVGLTRENKTIKDLTPFEFISLVKKYCEDVEGSLSELNKIKSLKAFSSSEINSIKNGLVLGDHIYNKLKPRDKIYWTGGNTGLNYPFDIVIGTAGFSLKEDSYILKNPAFSDYLNALVQPEKPFKTMHVFRHFAHNEFKHWFEYTYFKLREAVLSAKDNEIIFSYKDNYFIKRVSDTIVFGENGENRAISIRMNLQISEFEFNKHIPNNIIEHTFSKWIKETLEKDKTYLALKKKCSEAAGKNLKDYINSNYNPDIGKILQILQIYEQGYYYGKCMNGKPILFRVPSNDRCEIISLEIDYRVPRSQLNVLFTFEIVIRFNGHPKKDTVKMHVECRYSHGQFNGIPESKLYCKDKLEKLYEII